MSRCAAIHAELKTALQALGKRIDLVVFLTVGRVHGVRAPQRCRIGHPALIQVAIGAVKSVTHKFRSLAFGIDKQGIAVQHHFAVSVVRQFALQWRLKVNRAVIDCCRCFDLGLILHRNGRGISPGAQED